MSEAIILWQLDRDFVMKWSVIKAKYAPNKDNDTDLLRVLNGDIDG